MEKKTTINNKETDTELREIIIGISVIVFFLVILGAVAIILEQQPKTHPVPKKYIGVWQYEDKENKENYKLILKDYNTFELIKNKVIYSWYYECQYHGTYNYSRGEITLKVTQTDKEEYNKIENKQIEGNCNHDNITLKISEFASNGDVEVKYITLKR